MNKQRWLTLVVLAVLLVATSPKPALSSFTPVMEPEVRPVTDRNMGLGDVVSDEWLTHMRANLVSATPNWWDGSTQADARYGEAIASAGDFNGDGYDDLIVGARYYSNPSPYNYRSGRAWLYYGSASGLSSTPDLIFNPPVLKWNGFFGWSVGTAGDINNDGVDDIIIGMVNWSGAFDDEGAAFVYYGSNTTTPSTTPVWYAHANNQKWASMGSSVSTAGDVNGDGVDDIIVGAYRYNSSGAAFVWHGSATGLGATGTPANADWKVIGTQGSSELGITSTAGDVNGDTYDDIIIGAPYYDKGQTDEGLVMVWHGSFPNGLNLGVDGTMTNAAWTAEGNANNRRLGISIGTVGDVMGNGYDEVILGSLSSGVADGDALVFNGSSIGLGPPINATPADADWKVEDPAGGDNRNFSVQRNPGADVNGDGYDDAIIGINGYDVISGTVTLTNTGAVAVWYGSGSGLMGDGTVASADWLAEGSQIGEYMGHYVNTAGDVDNNGLADVAAGAPYYDLDPSTTGYNGRAYAYYASTLPTITSLSPASATAGGSAFTLTVNGTGFVNGASTVLFHGSNRATTFVSSTQLTASISAADIATGGTAGVTVFNSALGGGGISNTDTFTINNPLPTITSLSPASATAGGPDFTLTVNGTGFINGASTVRWNGFDRTTIYVSSTQLTASISAADITTAGTASVTVRNSAPGGGTSNTGIFTINNIPVPTITSLSPASATAVGSAFTLTVNGTGFIDWASTVRWNGADRATTFVSSTQLTASISAADIATAGTAGVTVFNSTPGGGTSNTEIFTINNPLPTITSLSPAFATAGGSAFTLTVNGTGFVGTSTVRWKGADRATTFVSSTQLTASISAADIATAGTASVTVRNSAPGGGTSNAMTFTINDSHVYVYIPLVLKSLP